MIWLIGPGGAGKSTTGPLLAKRLHLPFRDLDVEFTAGFGDIDGFIATEGYQAYAHANIEAYGLVARDEPHAVLALSSGFMTYPPEVHPSYSVIRPEIACSRDTFVLLPSLDLETCVAETVRRQMARPLTRRSPSREEAVIRERFVIYRSLPARKIATNRPASDVAAEIAARIQQTSQAEQTLPGDARPSVLSAFGGGSAARA
ncbi:MAG TPA: shikimate kinase [Longimicrobium sp.]|jgi:shikimate kinase